jgi:hypothetical protein
MLRKMSEYASVLLSDGAQNAPARKDDSGERIKEILCANRESLGELDNVFQGHIALAAFDTADIVPMETGPLREFLLRVPALFSEGT